MKTLTLIVVLHIGWSPYNDIAAWKYPKPFNYTNVSQKFANPNFVRDRFKHLVFKPAMPTTFRDRFRKPFTPTWMDYCAPYHCNDYFKRACGINRRELVFKWFQSGCHIILNNECATFRGNLKYDQTDPKFCRAFVMSFRRGHSCEPGGELVCAVSLYDNRVTLFRDKCALQEANWAPGTFDEFEQVDMGLCTYYMKEAALKLNEDAEYLLACSVNSAKQTTTMRIAERIRVLKDHIRNSLRNPSRPDPDPIPAYYESEENAPIFPISESNELKINDKFKLKVTKTHRTTTNILRTKTQQTTAPRVQPNERVTAISKSLVSDPVSKTTSSAVEIFYRKSFDSSLLNTPVPWLHCSEHITPYLKGVVKELTRPAKLQPNDYIVHRFINLLKTNISKMSRSEKKSLMFQMSKIKIRLYSWSSNSLGLLYNEIGIRYGQRQKLDFLALKRGAMNLIAQLNVDLSNRTKLLLQSRIFRPPCVPYDITGTTRFVPGSTLSKPSVRTPDSLECVRRDQNNNCI